MTRTEPLPEQSEGLSAIPHFHTPRAWLWEVTSPLSSICKRRGWSSKFPPARVHDLNKLILSNGIY